MIPLQCLSYIFLSFHLLTFLVVDCNEIGFIIMSQENTYHAIKALRKQEEIFNQIKNLHLGNIKVYSTHRDFGNILGYWTIIPLLQKLAELKNLSWFYFLDDITGINIQKVLEVFRKYNASQDIFGGYALRDEEPTIIHHFANRNEEILYPHFSAGFFISFPLIQKLSKLSLTKDYTFSIDAKYELAKFIWNNGIGVKLIHEPHICLQKNDSCASWIEESFPHCSNKGTLLKIIVAVKTCHKYHKDRIKVIKNTWANIDVPVNIFSDNEDITIPTIKIDVKNVPKGHCEKTLAILKYYVEKNITLDWLVIVDDDTLLSFQRLKKLLSCYNSSQGVALGERYGYSVANSLGYDYITGGGGMVFSTFTIKSLLKSCQCPSIDSPDDMILGMCLKKSNIPVTHLLYFHQARPNDYSFQFLKSFRHISFHKYWMVDPYNIYKEWLVDHDPDLIYHSEL